MIRIGLTVAVMAMGGFGLLTATADARSHGCRYSSAGQAPAIKNLRVSGGPCFAAELTADNIIATFNGNGGRLPHRPRGSSYRCHYRKTSFARYRGTCRYKRPGGRLITVTMKLYLPV